MLEPIDRQAALAEIDATIAGSLQRPEDVYIDKGLMMARKIIEKLPTVKDDTVRHGRWETWGYVFHGIEWKRCSFCGKCADVSYYGFLDGEIKMSTPAICGCCGTRMDADEIAECRAAADDYAEY